MTVLADTSMWVEFLRATGSADHHRMRRALLDRTVASTGPVLMEVFAGARDGRERRSLEDVLLGVRSLAVEDADFLVAAGAMRSCRRHGQSLRSIVDCLIAAVAIRHGVPVLHRDRDFDVIAQHTELRIA